MNNIIKSFEENGKDLFLFELDGKIATIAPELMAFEGYANPKQSWNDIKTSEDFEDNYEYKTLKGDDLKAFKEILHSYDLSTLVREIRTTLYEQYKSAPRLDIVLEEGIFGVMYASNSGHANKFKKFMRREVNPQLNKTGSFDVVENQINKIEDETEKRLRMKLKLFEEALALDPNDYGNIAVVNNTRNELNTYLQEKRFKEIDNKVQQLEDKVNRSAVVREGDCTAEAIARKFNIFSQNNKPHGQFAEHMAKKLNFYVSPDGNIGYQDDYVTVNLIQRGGVEVPVLKYSKLAVKTISETLVNEGLLFDEIEVGKRGKDKDKFKKAKIVFDTGNIWVNEVTYNLYS